MRVFRFLSFVAFAILVSKSSYLAAQLSGGGSSPAPEPAIEKLEAECNRGNGESCNALALRYYQVKDKSRGHASMSRACDVGHAQSCRDMGVYYYYGLDVKQDIPLAARYYERAVKLDPSDDIARQMLADTIAFLKAASDRAAAENGRTAASSATSTTTAKAPGPKPAASIPPHPNATGGISNLDITYFEANSRLAGQPYFREASDLAFACYRLASVDFSKGINFEAAFKITYALVVQQKGITGDDVSAYIKSNSTRIDGILVNILKNDNDRMKTIVNFCGNSFPEN
jgi:hypothetical protein